MHRKWGFSKTFPKVRIFKNEDSSFKYGDLNLLGKTSKRGRLLYLNDLRA